MIQHLSDLTDVHILARDVSRSVVYPGPRPVSEDEAKALHALLGLCQQIGKKDFVVAEGGMFWRGRHDQFAIDGEWYRLRQMPDRPFDLDGLPSPMNSMLKSILCSPSLRNGGLIYIVGSPGSGKTTTASATLVSRLQRFGGAAYTIEAPAEFPLNGWHGAGYCTQTQVAGDEAEHWAEAFRCVLRSQPAGESLMLYVGEVRDAESAMAMLRAASNGFLVIATGFGSDLISGLAALIKLAGAGNPEVAQHAIASLLRVLVYQRIDGGVMYPNVLVSQGGDSRAAIQIANGMLQHLSSEIQRQANMLHMGIDLMEARG